MKRRVHHLLVFQLLRNIARARTRNLNPGLGEESTGCQHEGDIDGSVDGVQNSLLHCVGRRHVIRNPRFGNKLRGVFHGLSTTISIQIHATSENQAYLPDTNQANEEVVGESIREHLRDDEDIGSESRLEHDGHVGGVKQLNGVGPTLATEFVAFDRDFNPEALEVDDNGEDDDGGNQVHDIR